MAKKLLKENKELMKQWDYEKNKDVDVSKITFSSGKKYWWKCSNGHSHYARVSDKNRGLNCPYCSGKKVLVGYNDLFTLFPNLKKEWDYEQNEMNPRELRPGSNKDAYWICSNNHNYKMRISHRTEGHGCPYCSGNKVLKGYNDLESWCKQNNNNSLEKWDYKKNKNNPSDYSKSSKEYVWWKCSICGNEYKNKISNEVSNIYCPKCNKRNRTSFPEQAIYFYIKKIFKDAMNGYKDIDNNISELDIFIPSKKIGIEYDGQAWHESVTSLKKEQLKYEYCKKQGITLIRFREKINLANKKTCDYLLRSSYNTSIQDFNKEIHDYLKQYKELDIDIERDRNKIYEQYYAQMKEKSLQHLFPLIAKEWDYEKNYPIKPDMIPAYINEPFFFKCNNNHSYSMNVSKRTTRNDGCPYCSGHKVLKGYNDLITTHSAIAKEWDYEKNYPLKPTDVSKGYDKKVWWICSICNNSYKSSPNTRTSQNAGCSVCKGGVAKKVSKYDLDGNYIDTYDSLSEAAKKENITPSAIGNACKRKSLCNNFQWRYNDNKLNIEKYESKLFNNKKVLQYDTKGNYITSYDSITLAEEKTGATKIGMVCSGKRKTSGGYIWKYDKK